MALGWMVQRGLGFLPSKGAEGSTLCGGHERNHLPQGHRHTRTTQHERLLALPKSPTERKFHFAPRTTAADFCAKSMSGIENSGDRLLLIDSRNGFLRNQRRFADFQRYI
jgi:hypothetical protein